MHKNSCNLLHTEGQLTLKGLFGVFSSSKKTFKKPEKFDLQKNGKIGPNRTLKPHVELFLFVFGRRTCFIHAVVELSLEPT